ncbi:MULTISPECIES: hypothetical protein [unclassified Streptomyces]|uniref:hypothetical protein n=1 Tax=unclassified Streptomyces TaxID=2593676 RepID=UPI0008DD3F4D|nr:MULTISPECIES: hypothetical protein [unclassified Streptomyces]OII69944.1 hypothetical protein BJP39_15565 [Streptomyces sp. CC77]
MSPSPPVLGLAFGVAVGFAGAFGGVVAFFVVLCLGLIGLLVGWVAEGGFDLKASRDAYRAGTHRSRARG